MRLVLLLLPLLPLAASSRRLKGSTRRQLRIRRTILNKKGNAAREPKIKIGASAPRFCSRRGDCQNENRYCRNGRCAVDGTCATDQDCSHPDNRVEGCRGRVQCDTSTKQCDCVTGGVGSPPFSCPACQPGACSTNLFCPQADFCALASCTCNPLFFLDNGANVCSDAMRFCRGGGDCKDREYCNDDGICLPQNMCQRKEDCLLGANDFDPSSCPSFGVVCDLQSNECGCE